MIKPKHIHTALITSLLGMAAIVNAAQVTLEWTAPTANTDGSALTNLAGYVVYYGTQPGEYDVGVYAGKTPRATVSNLQEGATYYFAVEAYSTWNVPSSLSPEIKVVAGSTPAPEADADGDGMPDAWETANFGGTDAADGGAEMDADSDGFANLDEYIAGTDPKDPDSGPFIEMTVVRKLLTLKFQALAATPDMGGSRYYTLERADSPTAAVWTPVTGYKAILGQDQVVTYQDRNRRKSYYRLNIWIE